MFYISAYLERNRDVYYERLLAISREGDWNGWISFFLEALVLQSVENSKKARAILELYNGMKTRMLKITRSQYSIQTIDVHLLKSDHQFQRLLNKIRHPRQNRPKNYSETGARRNFASDQGRKRESIFNVSIHSSL